MDKRWISVGSPGKISIEEGEQAPPLEDQVLVRSVVSAISHGTERKFISGEHTHGAGLFTPKDPIGQKDEFPFKIGYSTVGRIEEAGSPKLERYVGRFVFAYVPHQTSFTASISDLILIPEEFEPESFLLLPNLETAVGILMDSAPIIGEEILVLGQGIVGLLLTDLLSRFPIKRLVTSDPVALRRELSMKLGATESIHPKDRMDLNLKDKGFDLVIEVTGELEAIETAVQFCCHSGRLIIGSYYGENPSEISLGDAFHRKRIRLLSSQVSTIDPELSGRWTKERRMQLVRNMIPTIRKDLLFTHRYRFEEAENAYSKLLSRDNDQIQIIFEY